MEQDILNLRIVKERIIDAQARQIDPSLGAAITLIDQMIIKARRKASHTKGKAKQHNANARL